MFRWILISIALLTLAVVSPIGACSWDYPIWQKSKKSDTPLFRFVVSERYGAGYINREGKIVIKPQFLVFGNHGGDFFEGLANVTTEHDGDFYIDASGNRVIQANYLSFDNFSEGLVPRWFSSTRKSGYVDRTGNLVIPAKFDSARSFSDGLALVVLGGRYGYIDRGGEIAIPAQVAYASDFADGHALVIVDGPCKRIGYGPCEYPLNPPDVVRGLGAASTQSPRDIGRCSYSVIDKTGKILFTTSYIDAKQFSEGLAPMGDGAHWGYVDYSGKARIPLQFESAEPFSEGLARVRTGGKVGFIDKNGTMIIAPRFHFASDFSEHVAVVGDEQGKYSFIDPKGKRAIPDDFDAASDFVMGLAHVRLGQNYYASKWSYINHCGRAVFTYSDKSGRKQ